MTFTPDRSTITNVTQACPAVVTTSPAHEMITGMVARLVIPLNYGMTTLNGQAVHVKVLTPTSFSCYVSLVPTEVPVNSIDYPAFVTPTSPGLVASCLPIGEGATPVNDVAWQTKNGFCESPVDKPFLNDSTVNIPF